MSIPTIGVESLSALTRIASEGAIGVVDTEDGPRFALRFDYHASLVEMTRAIPGRKWDDAGEQWLVPLDYWRDVEHFAEVTTMTLSPKAQRAIDLYRHREAATPKAEPTAAITLDERGKTFVYRSGYSAAIRDECREIPGRRWDGKTKTWRFPLSAASYVKALAEKFDATVGSDAAPFLRVESADAAVMREASRAFDADIVVPDVAEPLYAYQLAAVRYAQLARWRCVIGDEPGLGKQQAVDTPVLTPTGWVRAGDICVGDRLIGVDGKPTRVVGVYPQGVQPGMRVSFADGASVVVGPEHLWHVTDKFGRSLILTTEQMANDESVSRPGGGINVRRNYERRVGVLNTQGQRQWRVPLVAPVQFDNRGPLPIEPYAFGVMLGDGSFHKNGSVGLSTDKEILDALGLRFREHGSPGIGETSTGKWREALKALGLAGHRSWEKFVPPVYLVASVDDRLSLLRGLLDTDGSPMLDGGIEFASTSEALVDAVIDLVGGLGGIARNKVSRITRYSYRGEVRDGRRSWRVNVKMPADMPPFALARKLVRWRPPTKYPPTRLIDSIEPCEPTEMVCFEVAAHDGLYVVGGHIVTHNTRVAIAATMLAEAWPLIVVCPTIVEVHWLREIAALAPWRRVHHARGQKPYVLGDEFDAVIVGYPNVAYWLDRLLEVQPRGLVIDELHYLKSKRAQRTMAVKSLAGVGHDRKHSDGSVERIRKVKGAVPHDGLVLGLTGTPFLNDASEMIEPLHILGRLTDLGGWKGYTIRYCGTGPQRLLELHDRLRSVAYIRREKSEVLKDLPAKRRTLLEVEGDPKVMREYRTAEASVLAYFREQAAAAYAEVEERGAADVLSRSEIRGLDEAAAIERAERKIMAASNAEHLVQIGVLRQLAAKAKIGSVVDYATEFRAGTDRPLPIYAHHREVIEAIAERLDGAEVLYGGQTTTIRQDVVDRFQDGKIPVLVLGIKAAGIGITLTAASDPLFVEQDWNPAGLEQAESRHHRIGQSDSVLVTYMTIPSTIDADMLDLIERKRVLVDAATDGKLDDSEGFSKRAMTSVASDLIERMTNRALGRAEMEDDSGTSSES